MHSCTCTCTHTRITTTCRSSASTSVASPTSSWMRLASSLWHACVCMCVCVCVRARAWARVYMCHMSVRAIWPSCQLFPQSTPQPAPAYLLSQCELFSRRFAGLVRVTAEEARPCLRGCVCAQRRDSGVLRRTALRAGSWTTWRRAQQRFKSCACPQRHTQAQHL